MINAARASIVALLLCWAFAAFADVAVPPLAGRVVDQTATLSGNDIATLQQTLKAFEQRKGSQIAVLIVPTTAPETIEQYSLRVAETWKIGRKKIDDGALLVIAKNDHKLRIEVGYGLEGALTDATAKRIIDETITPYFRSGNFEGGIFAGVARIIKVIDGETLPPPPPQPEPRYNSANFDLSFTPFILMALLFLGAILRGTLSRLVAAGVMAGIVALIAWYAVGIWLLSVIGAIVAFLVTLLVESPAPGLGDSGWSRGGGSYAGSSSSDSSGSSSSSSDSGGGGGSFGGGGASGSW
jgi:uncharacterized protein